MINKSYQYLLLLSGILCMLLTTCEKNEDQPEPYPEDLPVVQPFDYTNLLGCFDQVADEKYAELPDSYEEIEALTDTTTARVVIDPGIMVAKVSKYIYGNNVNQYSGNLNYFTKFVDYLKLLNTHVLRYPGGLHSNEFFWNAHGRAELPTDLPAKLLDYAKKTYTPYWVPGFNGDGWNFSLDAFYELLKTTHNEALFTVNYSYARYGLGPTPVQTAAHLAADWVRYDYVKTSELGLPATKYWEIGNENCANWASGYYIDTALNLDGQPEKLTPKVYGQHVAIFTDSMKKAAAENGYEIFVGSQNDIGVFEGAGNAPDWMVDHTYFTPYGQNSNARGILNSVNTEAAYYPGKTKKETAKYGLPQKPITMTEWNIFAEGSGQNTSYINGMHAVLVLGELIRNQYGMANRWDLLNGWSASGDDMGMFSLGNDPDGASARGNPRAMFYYMYYFQQFMGDKLISYAMDGAVSDLVIYPSTFSSGEMGIIVVNKGITPQVVQFYCKNFTSGKRYYYVNLTGGNERALESSPAKEMSRQVFINGIGPSTKIGGPINELLIIKPYSSVMTNTFRVSSPALSVQFILVE